APVAGAIAIDRTGEAPGDPLEIGEDAIALLRVQGVQGVRENAAIIHEKLAFRFVQRPGRPASGRADGGQAANERATPGPPREPIPNHGPAPAAQRRMPRVLRPGIPARASLTRT